MTGFIIGIAVLTILSQVPTVTGLAPTAGNNKVSQAFNVLLNYDKIDLYTVGLSLGTFALAVVLPRTRLGNFGRLVAVIVPSVVVFIFAMDSVQIVRNLGEIPSGIPLPHLPSLSGVSVNVITGCGSGFDHPCTGSGGQSERAEPR